MTELGVGDVPIKECHWFYFNLFQVYCILQNSPFTGTQFSKFWQLHIIHVITATVKIANMFITPPPKCFHSFHGKTTPLPLVPGNPKSNFCSYHFSFSRMSYKWSTVLSFWVSLLSLSIIFSEFCVVALILFFSWSRTGASTQVLMASHQVLCHCFQGVKLIFRGPLCTTSYLLWILKKWDKSSYVESRAMFSKSRALSHELCSRTQTLAYGNSVTLTQQDTECTD